jgi:CRP/FNR family transcriptional regulator, cyclic AMP receptor protein
MTYQLRVVPSRRLRNARRNGITGTPYGLQLSETSPGGPVVEERPFRSFPHRVSAGLEAISSSGTYPKGAILFVEGQKALGVFVVCNGRVKLSVSSADGKSLIVRRADAGELVGLPATISGKPYRLTAEALEPLQCNFIPRVAFRKFLREHGEAALCVAAIVSEMYDGTLNQVRYLGLSASTAEKLARFLLDLPHVPARNDGQVQASLPLTHKEIAEMIGSSRETVTRIFARFKREHLVKVRGSTLIITSRSDLEQFLAA